MYAASISEVLAPLYIRDTKCKDPTRYRIQRSWVEGLPQVRGQFGFEEERIFSSLNAVTPSGSMTNDLFDMMLDELMKGAWNREMREKAAARGLIILLGLPNSTAVFQVMDALFRDFKASCRERTIAVYSEKIRKRASDIKERRDKAISAAD